MSIRHLIAFVLVLGLGATGAMAASYTVYPTAETNGTGTTTYDVKTGGEALVYGGATTGTTREDCGYFKFDITTVPDATAVTSVTFNFYVNAANWPYWSVTPLSLDPNQLSSTPALIWDDIEAEAIAGYYAYQSEASDYGPGWKMVALEGTAVADLTAALTQDWFSIGAVSRDTGATYYLEIDGNTDPNTPYLVVSDDPLEVCDDYLTDLGTLTCGTPLTATGDTTGALDFCGNASGDAHFSFTVTEDRDYVISLCDGGTLYDSYLRLYDDACCGNEIAFNDDFCGLQSEITASLTAGTYYAHVEGYSTGEGVYSMLISCVVLPPSGVTCVENGADVDLTWTNNDTYAAIDIYQDGVLVDTLAGTETSYTVLGVTKGGHCYEVVADTIAFSDPCCLVFGYDDYDLLWDFEADDGGFVTEGTTGWQWGAPSYGPCFDTADGNVWATNLDGAYANASCFVLESPVIAPEEMGDKGGYICIEHCYDTEAGYDGGVVWFTTDDFWYYSTPPLEGWDAIVSATGCGFVAGFGGFTGSSDGWVTDCWEVTDQDYIDYGVKMVIAFGSDGFNVGGPYSGWMVDNITMYRNLDDGTIDCDYTITPLVGTVPFQTVHRLTLTNTLTGGAVFTRRVAARIAVVTGNGNTYNQWRRGFTNVAAGDSFLKQFPVNLPPSAVVIGSNTFTLYTEDVTPAPYNQPPYPPSGDTCTATNVVVANAP